jgi:SAM-dependent methyltransferase
MSRSLMAQGLAVSSDSQCGFDPTYFDSVIAVEDRHFWFRIRNQIIRSVVDRLLTQVRPGYHVLEIGCGTGNVLRVLDAVCTDGDVIGVELFEEGAARTRQRVNCPVVVGEIESLTFDHTFEIIGMFDVLEHIDDDVATLERVAELLAPDGRVLVTVPADPKLWSAFDVACHHHRRYTKRTLAQSFLAANLELEYMTPFMAALYPLARVARRRPGTAALDAKSVFDAEFKVNSLVNAIAYRLLLPDLWSLGRGRTLPFGTSLLAVAKPIADLTGTADLTGKSVPYGTSRLGVKKPIPDNRKVEAN